MVAVTVFAPVTEHLDNVTIFDFQGTVSSKAFLPFDIIIVTRLFVQQLKGRKSGNFFQGGDLTPPISYTL